MVCREPRCRQEYSIEEHKVKLAWWAQYYCSRRCFTIMVSTDSGTKIRSIKKRIYNHNNKPEKEVPHEQRLNPKR